MQFASGIPINLRATGEINNDGIASDRPVGRRRATRSTCRRATTSTCGCRARCRSAARARAEVIAEVKNLFNTVQWSGVSNAAVAVVTATGVPVDPLPTSGDQLTPNGGYEQRQLQIGFRFIF